MRRRTIIIIRRIILLKLWQSCRTDKSLICIVFDSGRKRAVTIEPTVNQADGWINNIVNDLQRYYLL